MRTDELADHLLESVLGALDVLTVAVGAHFGLYALLHRRAHTVAEAAAASGMAPRYAREWLEQQCVAGLVDVDDPALPAEERRYTLSDEHAAVLCDPDSLSYTTPFAQMVAAAGVQLPRLLAAYADGGGLGWEQYGEAMRRSQADANRPLFLQLLGPQWLPALPEVHASLEGGGRVADIGCGDGWAAIGVGLAYPGARVDGYDIDAASIAAAAANAAAHGVAERVRFHHADAAGADRDGSYDLVLAMECVHDMADPVAVLSAARRLVADGGHVVVMDERVPDAFTGPGDQVEQLMYGLSMMICLPDGLSHQPSVGTGTVMRAPVLRGYAERAGFVDLEVLPIDHDVFRFYRLVG